jgi:dipeptide/tripeptide permease
LLAEGIGLGLVFSTATNNATLGVQPSDSGVASATVNASQQIGGSMGTALLSTVAASATTGYLAGLNATPSVIAQASVHGYTVAFGWSAAIFAVGAIVAAGMFKRRAPRAEPASSVDWQLAQARPDTQRAD